MTARWCMSHACSMPASLHIFWVRNLGFKRPRLHHQAAASLHCNTRHASHQQQPKSCPSAHSRSMLFAWHALCTPMSAPQLQLHSDYRNAGLRVPQNPQQSQKDTDTKLLMQARSRRSPTCGPESPSLGEGATTPSRKPTGGPLPPSTPTCRSDDAPCLGQQARHVEGRLMGETSLVSEGVCWKHHRLLGVQLRQHSTQCRQDIILSPGVGIQSLPSKKWSRAPSDNLISGCLQFEAEAEG